MEKIKRFKLHEEDDITESRDRKRQIDKTRRKEHEHGGFDCSHCKEWITIHDQIGTHNRNHCPHCLWSRHLDLEKLGDRKSTCKNGMEPIALAFKEEGVDRYSSQNRKVGELMLVHECVADGQLRINRIAADDNQHKVLEVFHHSLDLPEVKLERIASEGIAIAMRFLEAEVQIQLFGKG